MRYNNALQRTLQQQRTLQHNGTATNPRHSKHNVLPLFSPLSPPLSLTCTSQVSWSRMRTKGRRTRRGGRRGVAATAAAGHAGEALDVHERVLPHAPERALDVVLHHALVQVLHNAVPLGRAQLLLTSDVMFANVQELARRCRSRSFFRVVDLPDLSSPLAAPTVRRRPPSGAVSSDRTWRRTWRRTLTPAPCGSKDPRAHVAGGIYPTRVLLAARTRFALPAGSEPLIAAQRSRLRRRPPPGAGSIDRTPAHVGLQN
jgi:hypothetical protein